MLALKPPATRGTALDLLSIGFARFLVIEEDSIGSALRSTRTLPTVRVPARTDNIAWPPALPS